MARRRNPFSAAHTSWAMAELAANDAIEEKTPDWLKRVKEIVGQVSAADLSAMLCDLTQDALDRAQAAIDRRRRAGVPGSMGRPDVSPRRAEITSEWNVIALHPNPHAPIGHIPGWLAASIVEVRRMIADSDLLRIMFKDAGAGLRERGDVIAFDPAPWLAEIHGGADPQFGHAHKRQIPKINPAGDDNPDREKAIDKYVEFQRLTPNKVGEFAASFSIPTRMRKVGKAKWVTYRSDKIDPATERDPGKPIDYIHEHDAGVCLYVPDGDLDTDVPHFITDVRALTKLGSCLGFAFVDADGNEGEGKGKRPLPELYCIPSGKALLVIQDKREILAIMWGGILGVEGRGIVG